jgi:hypothetical protein
VKALNPNDMQIHPKTQSIEFKIYNDYASNFWGKGKGGGDAPKTRKIKFVKNVNLDILC